ncbi:ZIP family metal transporter [Bacillus sp. Marseille-P3661]|uniref:ZIP family metal transporter n=1 Tax=Bacillus sp. Marseille-P3661 TaxID=1936234 RepID=UPI000C84D461|nr:ZIP family metal transporter [Bacillus sp. Marseille-P3661]
MDSLSLSNIMIILVFFATISGGVLGKVAVVIFEKNIDLLFIFCGGLLVGIIGFELIPHTLEHYSPIGMLIGCLVGLLLMILLDLFISSLLSKLELNGDNTRTFVFLFMAIAFHNIPTGMAVGTSMTVNAFEGTLLFAAIFLHHIPEGLTLMLTLLRAKHSMILFMLVSFLLAAVLGVGYNLGEYISNNIQLNSVFMGIAIVTLSYVGFYEILWKMKKRVTLLKFIGMLFFSIIVMVIVIRLVH